MELTEKDKQFVRELKKKCRTIQELKMSLRIYAEEEQGDCLVCALQLYNKLLKEAGVI